MDAGSLLRELCRVIDEHRWADLAPLLHADFTCHLLHTGERLDREAWVRLNADGPGFERVHRMTEVWADDEQEAPAGTRSP